jgi:hypothetical protein
MRAPVPEEREPWWRGAGITIGTLVVDDDVAVKDSTYTVGRRGVAGNFFVIKAVGAASEQGADLDELLRIGNKVNAADQRALPARTSVFHAPAASPRQSPRRPWNAGCSSRTSPLPCPRAPGWLRQRAGHRRPVATTTCRVRR